MENCLEPKRYQALSLKVSENKLQWRTIHNVIKHPRRTNIYKIKTQNGYELELTSCHSVYVWKNHECILKEGNKIREGDVLILPLRLGRNDKIKTVDLKIH